MREESAWISIVVVLVLLWASPVAADCAPDCALDCRHALSPTPGPSAHSESDCGDGCPEACSDAEREQLGTCCPIRRSSSGFAVVENVNAPTNPLLRLRLGNIEEMGQRA